MIHQFELYHESVKPTKANYTVQAIKSRVFNKDPDSKELKRALVISRTGRITGRNKHQFKLKI